MKEIKFLLSDDLCSYFENYVIDDRFINDCIKDFLDRSHIDWRKYNKPDNWSIWPEGGFIQKGEQVFIPLGLGKK